MGHDTAIEAIVPIEDAGETWIEQTRILVDIMCRRYCKHVAHTSELHIAQVVLAPTVTVPHVNRLS